MKHTFPHAQQVQILNVQTAAAGANWTPLPSFDCSAVEIVNNTGTALEYRRFGAGSTLPILDQTARMILGIQNADQIQVRRFDQSNTQVTVTAEGFRA